MLIEYIALGAYVFVLGLITWISARRGSSDDFLSASHDVGWKQLSVSFFSSAFSSYNVAVNLTFAFLFGPYVLLIFMGVLGAFGGIYIVARENREAISDRSFNNIIDLAVRRFDSRVTTVLHLSFVVILLLFVALQFFVNTSIFQELLGWNKYTSSIVVGLIVYLYISIGGLKTEILTDVFQGVLMLLIVALAFMVDTSSITTSTTTNMLSNTTALTGALSLGVVQLLTFLVQPEMWQRVAAARDLDHLKKGMVVGWVLLLVVIVPVVIIGVAVNASGAATTTNNLFLEVLNEAAPDSYLPFLLVGLFAAFMSTLDSSIFAAASQIGKYGFVIRSTSSVSEGVGDQLSSEAVARNTRIAIAAIVVLCLGGSLLFGGFLQGVFGLISMMTVISVVLICSFAFSFSSNEMLSALLVGIAAYVIALFGGYINDQAITTLYPSGALLVYVGLQKAVTLAYRRVQ